MTALGIMSGKSSISPPDPRLRCKKHGDNGQQPHETLRKCQCMTEPFVMKYLRFQKMKKIKLLIPEPSSSPVH